MELLAPLKSKFASLPHHDLERLARRLRLVAALILAFAAAQPLLAGSAAGVNDTSADKPEAVVSSAANSSAVDPVTMDPPTANDTLLLEVIVNGHSIGKIGEFVQRRGTLYARPQELRDMGFRVPNTRVARGVFMALNDLPGIAWRLDTANQQLLVTAIDAALVPNIVQPAGREDAEPRRPIESGTGLTLNYDTVGIFASGQNGGDGGSGTFDFRNFSPWGNASSDWITYAGATLRSSGTKPIVRLDSAYSFADVNSMRRYSVGDYIDNGLSWSRPVHMEGIQIRSDFSMRPDLITFPLPTLSGSAAVPSTVDVLVNGNLAASSEVSPGPFEIPQLPVISGEGTITMTLTNNLGGQVTVTQPFYGATTMLAKGLHTFAGQAGLVRRNWGVLSNDYGKLAAAAYYRRGLSQSLTVEATNETTPGTFMGGAGLAATLWHKALVNFDVAGSGGTAGAGELLSAGVQHQGQFFGLGGSVTEATANYRDIAAMNGSPVARKQVSLFSGLMLKHFGSLAVAYACVKNSPPVVQVATSLYGPLQSQVVTANYSQQFHRVSLFATEFRDLSVSGYSGMQVGLTIPLGVRRSASVGGTSEGAIQVQAQQSAIRIGDLGYQAYVSAGGGTQQAFGIMQYKSPVGLFSAGVSDSAGQTTARIESQGALSLVDRGLFPSNMIYDSFAIVDTAPVEHIHVYQENRDVGTTDKSGRLLVPDMRSFDVNHIGIEPRDVPADADLALDKRIVRPQDRSGVVIRFPIQFSHGALLKLVDQAGLPIPLGSTATLLGSTTPAPVGYDGETYLEGLSTHNRVSVGLVDGARCTVSFDYKPVPGDIPTIGPLRCREVKP